MKSIRKILITFVIILLIGTLVIPSMAIVLEKLDIKGNNILAMLNFVADRAIVKASDADYNYSGNLYVRYNDYVNEYSRLSRYGMHVYKESTQRVLEYSANDSEFKECEFQTYGSDIIDLDKNISEVVARDQITGDTLLKTVVIIYDGAYITLHEAFVGWEVGKKIYTRNNGEGENRRHNFEYSMDDGESFTDLDPYESNVPELFEKDIIIREKETGEIIYESPKKSDLGDLEEEYTYENGRTTVDFKLNGEGHNKASYSYEIDELQNGNSVTIENDSTIKLYANTKKEFMNFTYNKEIDAKVIKIEKPTIERIDNETLNVVPGEVTNDTLGKIFYSIDGGEDTEFVDEIKLTPGVHTVKVYQVSENHNVKSDEIEEEFLVEDNFDVLTDLVEEYTYENGKTVLNFNLPENIYGEENVQFSYVIDGEEKNGNEVTVENDTDVKLKISIIKTYKTYNFEKDVNVKVVKVEKPTIKQINDEEIKITAGEIINDTLDKIVYRIDDGEEIEFTKEFVLAPGVHTIKAYQTSKEKNVKSDEVEFEITIEEPANNDDNGNNNNNGNTNNDDKENNNSNGNTSNNDEENNNSNGNTNNDDKENNNGNGNTSSDDEENNNNNGNTSSGGKNITIIVEDDSDNDSKTSEEKSNSGNNVAGDDQKSDSQEDDQNSDSKKSENDKEIVDNNENANKEINNVNAPKTSDEISIFVALLICVIAINVVIGKKLKIKKQK